MQHLKKFLKGTYLSIFNILLATVVVLNCKGTYRIANKIFHIDKNLNIPRNKLYAEYGRIIDFINNPKTTDLSFESFTLSNNALYHFVEVRKIFIGIYIFLIFSISLLVIYLLINKKRIKKAIGNIPVISLLITIVTSFVIIAFSMVNFNYLFKIFHEIVFANDYWLFDTVKDSIILALPKEFFLLCATIILILSTVFTCIELIICQKIKGRIKEDEYIMK